MPRYIIIIEKKLFFLYFGCKQNLFCKQTLFYLFVGMDQSCKQDLINFTILPFFCPYVFKGSIQIESDFKITVITI